MEAIASFLILFTAYFLGCLALVQLAIRPMRRMVQDIDGGNKHVESNHLKILALSFLLSLITTTIAYMIFL
jgi:hypothetical protein